MNEGQRFHDLWNDFLEGELDKSGLNELRTLLAADPERVETAVDSYQIHRLLGVLSQDRPAHQEAFVRETLARVALEDARRSDTRPFPHDRVSRRSSTPSHPTRVFQKEQPMKPAVSAACLSLSLLAIFLSVYLSRGDERSAPVPSVEATRLAASIEALSARFDALERRQDAARALETAGAPESERSSGDAHEPGSVHDRFAMLQERLEALEDAETIARLAETGEVQIRTASIRGLGAELSDARVAPEERAARLYDYWKEHGSIGRALGREGLRDSQMVLPLLSAARDQTLPENVRIRLLAEVSRSDIEEVRKPLLELFWDDPSERIRQQVVRNLTTHAADVDAQNAILWASREDPSELVQGTAMRRLERVMHVAAEATPGSPVTQLTEDDLPKREEYEERRRRRAADAYRQRDTVEHRGDTAKD